MLDGKAAYIYARHRLSFVTYWRCRVEDALRNWLLKRDFIRAGIDARRDGCHAELLAIHEIACCGWANVLRHPITPEDTLTVRDVKIMAMELIKDRPAPETPNKMYTPDGV